MEIFLEIFMERMATRMPSMSPMYYPASAHTYTYLDQIWLLDKVIIKI